MSGTFKLGDWVVHPDTGEIQRGDERRQLQPLPMAVLLRLAEAGGELVSRDTLLDDVWQGRAMSDEPINRCIAELRAALDDSRVDPRYIKTLPRRGYQLLVAPEYLAVSGIAAASPRIPARQWALGVVLATLAVFGTWLLVFDFPVSDSAVRPAAVVIRNVEVNAASDQEIASALQESLKSGIGMLRNIAQNDSSTPDQAGIEKRVFDIVGQLERDGDKIHILLSLVMQPGDVRIPYMRFNLNENYLSRYVIESAGVTATYRMDFVLDPNGDGDVVTRDAMTQPDYAELLSLRAELADWQPYLAAQFVQRADRLIASYPDMKGLHGLKAKAMMDGRLLSRSDDVLDNAREEMAAEFQLNPRDPYALYVKSWLLDASQIDEVVDVYRELETAAPAWSWPHHELAMLFEIYGYTHLAYASTLSEMQLNPFDASTSMVMLAMHDIHGINAETEFARWLELKAGGARFPVELYYGHYSKQPQMMKNYLSTWFKEEFSQVDFDVIVDGIFDETQRVAGMVELATLSDSYKPRRSRWLLFALQAMYGNTADAVDTYTDEKKLGLNQPILTRLFWLPFAESLRKLPEFGSTLDQNPVVGALFEKFGPNDYCERLDDVWRCH